MTDENLIQIAVDRSVTAFATGTWIYGVNPAAGGSDGVITLENFETQVSKSITREVSGTIGHPNGWYTNIAPQIFLFQAPAAVTITRIHISGADSSPTSEMALDLKYADDTYIGGFANAVVMDVCDTTNGVFTATSSFDDATVPSGKYVYFQMDAAPHLDWKYFNFRVTYTLD